ncbi:hypothetical protein IFM89_028207 [Coptis chinensis]|uniref:Plant heme peroxidase family profile domain-containing protein n=1 Tax=Coptis chinensis TaxID=261450 RepID=A0A835HDP3_9MAGN|nr:hypothetical protein IFM89_028207 [Coptis chinensis]
MFGTVVLPTSKPDDKTQILLGFVLFHRNCKGHHISNFIEKIIRVVVTVCLINDLKIVATLLRMQFHDCFVKKACPGVVSCADIIALATRDDVALSGGLTAKIQYANREKGWFSLSYQQCGPSIPFNIGASVHSNIC